MTPQEAAEEERRYRLEEQAAAEASIAGILIGVGVSFVALVVVFVIGPAHVFQWWLELLGIVEDVR